MFSPIADEGTDAVFVPTVIVHHALPYHIRGAEQLAGGLFRDGYPALLR